MVELYGPDDDAPIDSRAVRPAIPAPGGADPEPTGIEALRAQITARMRSANVLEDEWRFASSPEMRAALATINHVAATDVTVLVQGESGVGKNIIPHLLHRKSTRCDGPLIKVDCAALPLELLESELFGYERGAFTGAHRQKTGKFELADKGTIFLDEIGELACPLQAKLLHILQDREFSRLGGSRTIRIDVRVVAATNKDLGALVQQQLFREDLYYRLNVVKIRVPALRDRRPEIPVLVDYFLRKFGAQYGRAYPTVRPETLQHFFRYDWPGNVRELENSIKRIVVLGSEAWVADELKLDAGARPHEPPRHAVEDHAAEPESLTEIGKRAAAAAERMALARVLEEVHWNRMEAARRLKVNYKTILAKIGEYQIGQRGADSRS